MHVFFCNEKARSLPDPDPRPGLSPTPNPETPTLTLTLTLTLSPNSAPAPDPEQVPSLPCITGALEITNTIGVPEVQEPQREPQP